MASNPHRRFWSGSWPASPKAWVSEARHRVLRSIGTRSSNGWWRPRSSSKPFRRIFCTSCLSLRSNSMSSTPCSVRCRGDISAAEAVARFSQSPTGCGRRSIPRASCSSAPRSGNAPWPWPRAVLHQIAQLVVPGGVPLFLRDGYPNYLTAIVAHFGQWVQPPRRQATGPRPSRDGCPCPGCSIPTVWLDVISLVASSCG